MSEETNVAEIVRAEREKMERNIFKVVDAEIIEFQTRTGLDVTGIEIDLKHARTISDPHVVGQVESVKALVE